MKKLLACSVLLLLTLMPLNGNTMPTDSDDLLKKLQTALQAKGSDYKPRTEHLLAGGKPKYLNRLILEDSPYLIQHAHNPVNWYPWGEEAFARAKKENKPIFLSIGYSTCHWCHVMERESFENPEIAAILNDNFISIKVDREQRPDIDEIYMTAVMMMTGRGGWPMSSFITAEGKTFYGGTYFPPLQFTQLLDQIHTAWTTEQAAVLEQANRVASAVAQASAASSQAMQINSKVTQQAVADILGGYDARRGGFSPAPKFPNEPYLFLLLDQLRRGQGQSALQPLLSTLKKMAQGGIYDQVGGGFHRYATDVDWLVPHFEKMLYNQAHLARVYLQAYQLTGEPLFKRVVQQTLDYVLREMTASEGGFYSAADADSEGEEGVFFVWSEAQLQQALNPEQLKLTRKLFAVTAAGNFEGSNILFIPVALDEYAKQNSMLTEPLLDSLDVILKRLREVREQRIHPLRDDKILTAWNGMMITTLAAAGKALNEPRYLEAATKSAAFLWTHNRAEPGRLWRAHLQGSSSVIASEEDYAYLAEALLELYDVTGNEACLTQAIEIADAMLAQFWDGQEGGLFMNTGTEAIPLMSRPKNSHDGAIPSGNSVALKVLLQLVNRTGNSEYEDKAKALLAVFSDKISKSPAGYSYMLLGAEILQNSESGAHQYAARGAVAVRANTTRRGQIYELTLDLKFKDGWHINSNQPIQKELLATVASLDPAASGWRLVSVQYPEPKLSKLGFLRSAMSLYEGETQIKLKLARINDSSEGLIAVQLQLQACNQDSCLAPEQLYLRAGVYH